ncbi:hypothetical protein PMAYCL1PPCAC_00250, partial [Pristionchus mayeri]
TWDCKLEKAAAAVASTCQLPKRTRGQNTHFPTIHQATAELMASSGLISSAATLWSSEFDEFTYGWPSVNYTVPIALYDRISEATQMALAETKRVGCSVALCDSKHSALVVCMYK